MARLGFALALIVSLGCSDSKVSSDGDRDADIAAGSGGGGAGGTGGMSGAGGTGGAGGMSGAGGDAAIDAGDQEDAAIDAATDAAIEDAGDAGDVTDSGDPVDAGPDAGDAADPQGCTPLTEQPCEGNEVGACTAGTRTCLEDGSGYGDCEGVVLPGPAQCGDDDFDCNGQPDGEQDVDEDGDGFSRCVSDCCDRESDCEDPASINPGAYDYAGNSIDDDCSGTADDAASACDDALASDSSDALDYARALELCRTTTAAPPAAQRTWGVLSARFERANGTGTPVAAQRSIRPDFGAIGVRHGASMLVLSTGSAAAPGDVNPSFIAPSLGTDHATTSPAPADWLAAHSNAIPASPGCPQVASTTVHDPIMLTLQLRVPTNARAFTVDGYYLSSDYPEWVCSTFTDYFVALLSSSHNGTPANPTDRNIAAYFGTASVTPMSVNLANDTGFFRQCINGATGCSPGSLAGTTDDCVGTAELTNTGFDAANTNLCTAESIVGGGTGWLRFGGNVVPGELAYLRFAIWDNTDGIEDSHVLLDNLRWLADPITPGIQTE